MNKFRRCVETFNLAVGYFCGLGILVMGLILTYEVICRYWFDSPTVWAQETAGYLFIWTMLAGCAYTLMEGKHIRFDLVLDLFPLKAQRFLDALTSGIGAAFCAIVAWQAWEMVVSSLRLGKVSPTLLRIPMWIPQVSLLIGFGMLTLQFIIIAAYKAREIAQGESTGKENVR